MRKLVLLTILVLMTAGVGPAIRGLTRAPSTSMAAPPNVTISIDDIHRQIDGKSLPVREVREPF
jgi:hypothetical protein